MKNEITKGRVLEIFTQHFQKLNIPDKRERVVEAHNATLDTLAPRREGMSSQDRTARVEVLQLVIGYLDEILKDDHGITPVQGRPMSDIEVAASNEGAKAAEQFLKTNAQRLPAFPTTEKGGPEWMRLVHAQAFEVAPVDSLKNKEWTSGFLAGFVGVIWRYQQNQKS